MNAFASQLHACRHALSAIPVAVPQGRVRTLVGNVLSAEGVHAELGSLVRVHPTQAAAFHAEVVGFRGTETLLLPLAEPGGVRAGDGVETDLPAEGVPDARAALGRVINGLGVPIDAGPRIRTRTETAPLATRAPTLLRERVREPLDVGIRSINALLTVGRGARMGLFASSGVGKSTLLGQMARSTKADAVVVALIGERGREVRDFVEESLGEALAHSIVVVATSDDAAVLRRRAAQLATQLAEDLRAEGRHVLLLMDSLSRFAAAQREIGLAAGEPPATRGYPPSVWSALPKLVERAGTVAGAGSITALYTVLFEGDEQHDPIAEAIRSLLDGHFVLSRRLAERGRHPAIDPLASVSRVMSDVATPEALALATRARAVLATYADAEDLISIGAHQPGQNLRIDEAIRLEPALAAFLAQERSEACDLEASWNGLASLLQEGSAA